MANGKKFRDLTFQQQQADPRVSQERERFPGLSEEAAIGNIAGRAPISAPQTSPQPRQRDLGVSTPTGSLNAPTGQPEASGDVFSQFQEGLEKAKGIFGEQRELGDDSRIRELEDLQRQGLVDRTEVERAKLQKRNEERLQGFRAIRGKTEGRNLSTFGENALNTIRQQNQQRVLEFQQQADNARNSLDFKAAERIEKRADKAREEAETREDRLFSFVFDAIGAQTEQEAARAEGATAAQTEARLGTEQDRRFGLDVFKAETTAAGTASLAQDRESRFQLDREEFGLSREEFEADEQQREFDRFVDLQELDKDPEDEILSATDAERLGVPFGTTTKEAIEQGISPSDVFSKEDKFNLELKLADKFRAEVGDSKKALTQLKIIKTAGDLLNDDLTEGQLNPVSQGILVTFQKILDPTSVVRESEYARSGQGQDLIGRMEGFVLKLREGGAGVTKENLQGFVSVANAFAVNYEQSILDAGQLAKTRAENNDLNIDNVLSEDILKLLEESDTAAPLPRLTKSFASIDALVSEVPEFRDEVIRLSEKFPDITDDEILQTIEESQSDFNNVGSDTNTAANFLGNFGQITGFGSPLWKHGLDVDLKIGDPVPSPIKGKVVFAGDNGGFGNQVKIKGADGNEYWLSHLDSIDVKVGDTISPDQLIGKGGNTGDVIPLGGGDGSHLDITVKDPSGKFINPRKIKTLLA